MRVRDLAGYALIGAAVITLALLAGTVATVLLVRQAVIEIRDNVRRRTDTT